MMRARRTLALLLTGLAVAPAVAEAQDAPPAENSEPTFAVLSGRVFYDLDRSFSEQPGEPPVVGLPVDLVDNGAIKASTVTDVTGSYAFPQPVTLTSGQVVMDLSGAGRSLIGDREFEPVLTPNGQVGALQGMAALVSIPGGWRAFGGEENPKVINGHGVSPGSQYVVDDCSAVTCPHRHIIPLKPPGGVGSTLDTLVFRDRECNGRRDAGDPLLPDVETQLWAGKQLVTRGRAQSEPFVYGHWPIDVGYTVHVPYGSLSPNKQALRGLVPSPAYASPNPFLSSVGLTRSRQTFATTVPIVPDVASGRFGYTYTLPFGFCKKGRHRVGKESALLKAQVRQGSSSDVSVSPRRVTTSLSFTLENLGEKDSAAAQIRITLPGQFTLNDAAGAQQQGQTLTWKTKAIKPGDTLGGTPAIFFESISGPEHVVTAEFRVGKRVTRQQVRIRVDGLEATG